MVMAFPMDAQVNRDLVLFIEDARKAAASLAAASAGSGQPVSSGSGDAHAQAAAALASPLALPSDSLERIIAIAERCLEEETGAFRHSIQAVVDQLEELRRGCASREARGWATRLLFILTRCSRLVATEESSLLGSGGGPDGGGAGSRGGSAHGASAYMTVQPRGKGPGRLRRFSGFPMLRSQLSLDPRGGAPHLGTALPVSPRGSASPLLRSATAPSRSLKGLMAGMHHLRIHGGEGGGHKQQLSPMPESPSMVASPATASASSPDGLSTPSHAVRQVGLSPLGRSVVTALEAELEQAAAQQTACAAHRQLQSVQEDGQDGAIGGQAGAAAGQQQQVQLWLSGTPAPPRSSGTASPLASDSPTKRHGLFKMLKARFQSLRSASKEPRPAADSEGSPRTAAAGSTGEESHADVQARRLIAAHQVPFEQQAASEAAAAQQQLLQHQQHVSHVPLSVLRDSSTRRAMSADVEGIGGSPQRLRSLHPGLQKALTLQVDACGSPLAGNASPLGASPRRVVCRICEEPVVREALHRHSRVCAALEAVCKQVRGFLGTRCSPAWAPVAARPHVYILPQCWAALPQSCFSMLCSCMSPSPCPSGRRRGRQAHPARQPG